MNRLLGRTIMAGALLAGTGCASTPAPPPTLQTGPDAEVTIDGLVRVDNSVIPLAYVKPDADLTGYTKFILDPVEVAYQKDPGNTRQSGMGGGNENFALTPRQMENFRSSFQEEVVQALTKDNGYELVTEAGPEVLRITASLLDLVVSVPTERTAGRQTNFTRSYGLVSLIVELRDSESGEILARAGDRRDPTRNTDNRLAEVSPAFVRADVQRLFRHWAELLRERLDALREM